MNDRETTVNVWIVDDDPVDREITSRALRKAGVEVATLTLESGEAALKMLERTSQLPSLIFMDVKMPGMGGLDALCRIKADPRTRQVPVVMVTNSPLKSDRDAAMAAGADHFVQKAFDLREYTEDIRQQLLRWLPAQRKG